MQWNANHFGFTSCAFEARRNTRGPGVHPMFVYRTCRVNMSKSSFQGLVWSNCADNLLLIFVDNSLWFDASLKLQYPSQKLQCIFLLYPCLYTGTMPTQLLPNVYAEWKGCLRRSFPRLGAYASASANSLLDGHALGKWWKICPRDSAYATKIYIASTQAYARLHGLWNIRSSAYAAL